MRGCQQFRDKSPKQQQQTTQQLNMRALHKREYPLLFEMECIIECFYFTFLGNYCLEVHIRICNSKYSLDCSVELIHEPRNVHSIFLHIHTPIGS